MHELSIATEIYQQCRAHIAGTAMARLERVSVAVGELSAVEPDLLRFAWEALTAEGPDRGAVLEIDWRPATQVCKACGGIAERAPGEWLLQCPRCDDSLAIEGGRELDLLQLSYSCDTDSEPRS